MTTISGEEFPGSSERGFLTDTSTVILFFLALCLFIPVIFLRPAWHDEIYTLRLIATSPGDILSTLRGDSGPPLYYFISWLWAKIVGVGIIQARLLSLGFTMGSLYYLRRVTRGPMYWFLLHPLIAAYAVEARNYALLLFTMIAVLFYLRQKKPWFALLFMTLSLYTHNLSLFLLPAWIILAPRFFYIPLAAFSLYLPWWPVMMGQPRNSIAWMAAYSAGRVNLLTPISILSGSLAPGEFLSSKGIQLIRLFPAGALTALALPGIRKNPAPLFALFITAGGVAAYCFMIRSIYFPGRTEIILLPLIFLIAGSALKELPPLRAGAWSSILISFSLIVTLTLFIGEINREPASQNTVNAIAPHLSDGDILIFTGHDRLEVTYLLQHESIAIEDRQHPLSSESHPGWLDLTGLSASGWREENRALTGKVKGWLRDGRRVYLLRNTKLPELTLPPNPDYHSEEIAVTGYQVLYRLSPSPFGEAT